MQNVEKTDAKKFSSRKKICPENILTSKSQFHIKKKFYINEKQYVVGIRSIEWKNVEWNFINLDLAK